MPQYQPYPGESEQEFMMRMLDDLRSRNPSGPAFNDRYPQDGAFNPSPDPRMQAIEQLMGGGGRPMEGGMQQRVSPQKQMMMRGPGLESPGETGTYFVDPPRHPDELPRGEGDAPPDEGFIQGAGRIVDTGRGDEEMEFHPALLPEDDRELDASGEDEEMLETVQQGINGSERSMNDDFPGMPLSGDEQKDQQMIMRRWESGEDQDVLDDLAIQFQDRYGYDPLADSERDNEE